MIKSSEPHLDITAASHPGRSGKKNEDRYAVNSFFIDAKHKTPVVFTVISDGIGGHRAGEVAAEMAVTGIMQAVFASDGKQPLDTLKKAITQVNQSIYNASLSDQGRKGMGATCACAWVIDDKLYTANLGDSRIYLLRGDRIIQLTTDHTWMQEAIDAGIIDEDLGNVHPNAHVIRRYLGSIKPPQPDFRLWFFEGESDTDALENQGLRLLPDDVVLVCSDGLTDLVADDEIADLAQTKPFKELPNILIDLANARGGHDNITVILMKVPREKFLKTKRHRRSVIKACLMFIILLLGMAGAYFGWRWHVKNQNPLLNVEPQITQALPTKNPFETQAITSSAPSITPENQVDATTLVPSMTPWPTHTIRP